MRKALGRAGAIVAMAGALAIGGGHTAAAAPAPADGGSVQVAMNFYNGFGTGSSPSLALWLAQSNAENKARVDGYNPIVHCHQTYSNVREMSQFMYWADVQILCNR